jgi:hypothetical protein
MHAKILVGISERKGPLGRSKRRRENNIKVDLNEIECDDMEWIKVALDRDSLETSSDK